VREALGHPDSSLFTTSLGAIRTIIWREMPREAHTVDGFWLMDLAIDEDDDRGASCFRGCW
jgi:hypothetical protein